MSMNCSLLGLTPAQIDGLVATPEVVMYLKRVPRERRRQAEEARERLTRLGPFERPLDIGKWWHILHYCLTGKIWPVGGDGEFLLTGQDLGENLAYGPATLHTPAETKDFSRFLEVQDLANLQARISLEAVGRLYPLGSPTGQSAAAINEDRGWTPDILRNNVGRLFVDLRDYIHEMSDKGNGVLIWVI